jgi:hypothetical protein
LVLTRYDCLLDYPEHFCLTKIWELTDSQMAVRNVFMLLWFNTYLVCRPQSAAIRINRDVRKHSPTIIITNVDRFLSSNRMDNHFHRNKNNCHTILVTTAFCMVAVLFSLAMLYSTTVVPLVMAQGGNATVTPPTQAADTFSAEGEIAGVLTEGQEMTKGGGSTEGNQTSQQLPWIVGGDWNAKVDKGNVTDFMANFTMVKADGSKHHGHTISNLTTKSGGIRLDVNGNATMNGTSIIKVNGTDTWTGVDTKVNLDNFEILGISLNPEQVENHFGKLPITGIVTSLTTQNGTEVLTMGEKVVKQQQQISQGNQSQSQSQAGNQTKQSQKKNDTGGPLGQAGETLQKINPLK